MSAAALPPGYVRSTRGSTVLVAREWAAGALGQALAVHGSLYRWAGAQPGHEALSGRGVTWAATLAAGPGTQAATPVVVRHSRHGGVFAALTVDVFPRPTRAPRELATAVRLAAAGVPTPEVVAYTVHPVAGLLARSDVMTRRLPPGLDFPDAWRAAASETARDAVLQAVAALLRALSTAGAHHPDLNVKNIYVTSEATPVACVLDVDRVRFADDARAAAGNFARLARSVRKWQELHDLTVGDAELVRLASLAWVDA
ncbi:MAG: lipopolysaccharide kinase InaA family protein [Gemmatimonadaceae bacterium]